MATQSLGTYLDAAMRRAHTDSVQLEREHRASVGLKASWIRALKSGKIKSSPNPVWIATLAKALSVPELDIWQRLGRFDEVARLRGETPAGMEETPPAWAVQILRRLDEISERLDLLSEAEGAIRQAAQQVAEELAAIQQPDDEQPPPTPIRPRGTPRG